MRSVDYGAYRCCYPPTHTLFVCLFVHSFAFFRPADDKSNRMLKDAATDIIALADALKLTQFGVVGVGLGGPYAVGMNPLLSSSSFFFDSNYGWFVVHGGEISLTLEFVTKMILSLACPCVCV